TPQSISLYARIPSPGIPIAPLFKFHLICEPTYSCVEKISLSLQTHTNMRVTVTISLPGRHVYAFKWTYDSLNFWGFERSGLLF
ncbi:hypothetical protein, partial [Nostoc sp.]|uniref:hypothetical protein n=1 Tax=Nostoc sp. TaxID=1180 RepID=UPI002FF7B123